MNYFSSIRFFVGWLYGRLVDCCCCLALSQHLSAQLFGIDWIVSGRNEWLIAMVELLRHRINAIHTHAHTNSLVRSYTIYDYICEYMDRKRRRTYREKDSYIFNRMQHATLWWLMTMTEYVNYIYTIYIFQFQSNERALVLYIIYVVYTCGSFRSRLLLRHRWWLHTRTQRRLLFFFFRFRFFCCLFHVYINR